MWKNRRAVWLEAGLGGMVLCAPLLVGCLQQQDVSADALTSFVEETPGASKATGEPRGARANAAIDGSIDSAGPAGTGGESGDGSAGPAGDAGGPVHRDMPPGAGSGTTPLEGAPSSGHTEVVGSPDAHPHSEQVHVDRPPGFGSSLPPEGKPEAVPVPGAGSGQPVAPPPGTGQPDKVAPQQETPFERDYKGKKMVTLAGEIVYDGKLEVPIDLDCFVPDKTTPAGRKLVNKVKLHAAGPYSFKVPANFGKLIVTGFIDLKANGPDSKDPQAAYEKNPVEIKDRDVTGVNLVFTAPAGASR